MLNGADGDGLVAEGFGDGIVGLGATGSEDDLFGAGVNEFGDGGAGVFAREGSGVTWSVESGGVAETGDHSSNHSGASYG